MSYHIIILIIVNSMQDEEYYCILLLVGYTYYMIDVKPATYSMFLATSYQGQFQNFVEWFPEQLQLSRQIQRFMKGGAYSSNRSLKQGVWGLLQGYFSFKEQNDTNHKICIAHSHNINNVGLTNGIYILLAMGLGCGGWSLPYDTGYRLFHGQGAKITLNTGISTQVNKDSKIPEVCRIQGLGQL